MKALLLLRRVGRTTGVRSCSAGMATWPFSDLYSSVRRLACLLDWSGSHFRLLSIPVSDATMAVVVTTGKSCCPLCTASSLCVCPTVCVSLWMRISGRHTIFDHVGVYIELIKNCGCVKWKINFINTRNAFSLGWNWVCNFKTGRAKYGQPGWLPNPLVVGLSSVCGHTDMHSLECNQLFEL